MKNNIAIQKLFFSYKIHFFILFIMCLLMLKFSSAQNFDTVQIKTSKLTESIYMLEGSGGGNIGLCIGKDGTFMIDDHYAPLTGKIKDAIAKLTDKPVQFIINTHWHGDHSGGNENFGGEGAIIVSQENSRKRMEADQFFGLPPHTQAAYSPAGLPKITFTQSMTFYYNGETIQIFHIADAHTDGDGIIYFKKSDVIHMGDVFVRYGFPFIDEPNGGNINGMIETIDSVINRISENTKIIPGHGQLSSKKDLVEYNNMLRAIRGRVKKLMDEGKTMEQIIAADPLTDLVRKGSNINDIVKVVYNSILKSKR
jgi:glyoxylase-like metal-dependent hydrolase (beta-lactamase superfamily II)